MKKFIHLLFLLGMMVVYVGCESNQRDENIQQQQEAQASETTQAPHIESEHGGNAGNR